MSRLPVFGHPAASVSDLDGTSQQPAAMQDDWSGGAGITVVIPPVQSAKETLAEAETRTGLDTTTVLPYASSRASKRTRWLRAWMMTAPIDIVALLAPLLVTQNYWRGTLVNAGLTVAFFAAGGLYRPRRHVSILDELPSLGAGCWHPAPWWPSSRPSVTTRCRTSAVSCRAWRSPPVW
ncbi:hypothetical protein [Micromonospora palomenae]|uniref:hypothetical protein n=1 Tax=Micromonospora palomenae TaxID=1461247 RepID=UPI003F88748A